MNVAMWKNILIVIVVFPFLTSCGAGKHLRIQTENRDTSSHLETDYAESDARIDPDGTLHHSLRNKPQEKPVPVEVPQTQKDSIVYRDRYISETIEVPRDLTAWQKWQMRSFWILLSGLAVFVIRKPLLALIRNQHIL